MCLCPALHKGMKEDKRECDVVRFLKESAFWKTEHQGRVGKRSKRQKALHLTKGKNQESEGTDEVGCGLEKILTYVK